MTMNVSIESDLKRLRRGLRDLEKQAVPKATVRTLNRVANSTKTASAWHIAPQIGSRQAAVIGLAKPVIQVGDSGGGACV